MPMTGGGDYGESRLLKSYLDQVSKIPMLTEKEEAEVGAMARKGDMDAIRKLVTSNLRFVVSYAKHYTGMGLSLLDLIHEGNIGLIEAAMRFDPGRNVRFISYAVWWVRQAMIHALSQYSRIFHVPQKVSDRISNMKKKKAQLKTELGREPTRAETAEALGVEESALDDLELIVERNLSLSETQGGEDDLDYESRLSDESEPPVEYQIIKSSIQNQLREVLGELDEKERTVLKSRFGLDDDRPMTLQEIGDKLHLSRERIRQIEARAMLKLSRSRKLQQLRGYLN